MFTLRVGNPSFGTLDLVKCLKEILKSQHKKSGFQFKNILVKLFRTFSNAGILSNITRLNNITECAPFEYNSSSLYLC